LNLEGSAVKLLGSANFQKSMGDNLAMGTKKTGKGRRKIGRKKRRMRAKIRHRKD